MSDNVENNDRERRSGAEIEHEIGALSDQLGQQKPQEKAPAAPAEPDKSPLDSPWLAAVLLVIALAMTVANLAGPGLFSGGEGSDLAHETADPLRDLLLFAVEEVEVFREEQGRLPLTLEDIGLADESGLDYRVIDREGYLLKASDDKSSLSFTSSDDPKAFFGVLWSES